MQDFKSVVLRKQLTNKEKVDQGKYVVEKKEQAGKNKQGKQQLDMRKLEDEDYKPPVVNFDLKIQMQKARNEKKLTQGQLAKLVTYLQLLYKNMKMVQLL